MNNKIIKFKNFKNLETRITSGIVFIYNNKILLLHPSNEKWNKTFSYPKGHIDKNENIKQAAIRETKEEINLNVPSHLLKNKNLYRLVDEDNESKGIIKIDYYYIVKLKEIDFLNLFKGHLILKKRNLQKKEIDWAGFLNKKQAINKIKPRLNKILIHI